VAAFLAVVFLTIAFFTAAFFAAVFFTTVLAAFGFSIDASDPTLTLIRDFKRAALFL